MHWTAEAFPQLDEREGWFTHPHIATAMEVMVQKLLLSENADLRRIHTYHAVLLWV
jgi:hypothetical protein